MSQLLKEQNSYNIYDVLNKNCMDYARYVLKYRCIPDLRDGCKPIHKRILYSFYKNKLTNDKPRAKSCNACGGVLAYSPHGDASVYEACVRLTNDSVNLPLIDGKGSFSSHTSRDVYAGASRYTEMRLSKITEELLGGIEKNNVDFVPTYDEARTEPTVLPASFPLILCNPNIGIGVGISSSIASFNIEEVIDYTIKMLKNEELPLLCPDFPTGGNYIYNKEELQNIHMFGKGSLTVSAKYHFEENAIVITEIPYSTKREVICEKIIELIKDKTLTDVLDVNDYTGVNGLNITIDVKKGANKDLIISKLFAKTTLRDNFFCNFNVLDNGIPKLLGIESIVQKWIEFRRTTLIREMTFDIDNLKEEKHLLEGLLKIIDVINDVIEVIKASETDLETLTKLKERFSLTEKQARYIMEIKLRSLNKEWIKNKTKKFNELLENINDLTDKINNKNKIDDVIISQLKEVSKKYGKPRMTTVTHDTTSVSADTFIEDYNCHILITEQGYIKKTLKHSDSQKLKDGDYITQHLNATNKDKLLLFTDKANCYYLNVYDLQSCQPSTLGTFLPTLLNLEKDECIVKTFATNDFTGYLLFAYENGKVAKINMDSYKTKYNRTKIINAYNTDSTLLNIHYINDDTYFTCVSSIDKVLVFDTSLINPKSSKNSQGVNVLKSKKDSHMIQFEPCDMELEERDYYICNIPAIGKYAKKKK